MLIQAAGLALLAALSPTALLVAHGLPHSSSRPRVTTAFYLAGAVVVRPDRGRGDVLEVLRSVSLRRPSEHHAQAAACSLFLGILLLAAAIVVARRKQNRPLTQPRPSRDSCRSWWPTRHRCSAFFVGGLIFALEGHTSPRYG